MTLIISMCTKKAIYTISDMKKTYVYGSYEDSGLIKKYIILDKNRIVISFWGAIDNDKFKVGNVLEELKNNITINDDISTISLKLKSQLEKLKALDSDDELGFHIAAYSDCKPHLRHVFHTSWLNYNQFIDENCNNERHNPLSQDRNRQIIGFEKILYKDKKLYPLLFNGENSIPNLIINGIQSYQDYIDYMDFSDDEAMEFLKLLMNFSFKLQKFRIHFKEMRGELIGYPLNLVILTPEGIIRELEIKQNEI